MAKHLLIKGLVQGVGYRESMCREATRLGVSGWVRNRIDGSVEAVIDGDETAVAEMLAWTYRGPAVARITEVVVSESDEQCLGFIKRPTI